MLKSFFGSLARYLVLTVTVLAVLSQFGIQTTSLVAVIGAASLAVGLALQGTLSNLAAGIMLLIFRPFRVGHKVQIIVPYGGKPCVTSAFIRRRHTPARCASGFQKGSSLIRQSTRSARS